MFSNSNGGLFLAILLFSLFSILNTTSSAQDLDTVTVRGKVLNVLGQSLPDAAVELISNDGKMIAAEKTRGDGFFIFHRLRPTSYEIKVHAEDYAQKSIVLADLRAGNPILVTIVLLKVTVKESVEVSIGGNALDRMPFGAFGKSFSGAELSDLPVWGAGQIEIAKLVPGAYESALSTASLSEDPAARPSPFEQGPISLGGGTSYSNNFTVDGFDNNDDRTAGLLFDPSAEEIKEVQVMTQQFSAEYGRASGGRINVISIDPEGKLRATASYRLRDERLNANSWQNNSRNQVRRRLREGILSFQLSTKGRRFKDREIFAVVTGEIGRNLKNSYIDTFLPVIVNTRFPITRPNTGSPICESGNISDCTANPPSAGMMVPYRTQMPTPDKLMGVGMRFGIELSPHLNVQLGFNQSVKNSGSSIESTARLEEAFQLRTIDTTSVKGMLRWQGTRWFGQAQFQRSSHSPSYQSSDRSLPVIIVSFKDPDTSLSKSLVAGAANSSTLQNFSDYRTENKSQLKSYLGIASERSELRFGGEYQSVESLASELEDGSGTFNFASMFDYGRNRLSRYRQAFGLRSDVQNTYGSFWSNIESRLLARATATFGFRFEHESAIADGSNLAPRAAFVLGPVTDGKLVFRVGIGTFFNRVLLRTVGDSVRSARGDAAYFDSSHIGTSALDQRRIAILAMIAERFPTGFKSSSDLLDFISHTNCGSVLMPVACPRTLGMEYQSATDRRISPDARIPRSRQLNIAVEKRLGEFGTASITFGVNETVRLWREVNINAPILPLGFYDWTDFLVRNPFEFINSNGTKRTYVFYLGNPLSQGVSTQPNGSASCTTTRTITCFVNLNWIGTSSATPESAGPDSTNAVGSPLGIAGAAVSRFRPYGSSVDRGEIRSIGRASSHSLSFELNLRQRNILGAIFNIDISYVLGLLRDDGINNTSDAEINGDFSREWSRGLQDRRHRFSSIASVRLPHRLGGFNVSQIFHWASSAPFNIGTGTDRNLDGSSTDRPIFLASLESLQWRRPGAQDLNPFNAFSLPPIGASSGSLPRNAGIGPAVSGLDVRMSRQISIGRNMVMSPGIEVKNVLNSAVFSYGAEYVDFSALGMAPTPTQLARRNDFLVPTRSMSPREIRLTARIQFK